jgi:CubicO group peptidase (beta-lactamase class C family)
MRDRILRPLDMTQSGYSLSDVDPSELALSYDSDGTASPFRSYTALAAASLYSTATDMARFLAAHQPGQLGEPVGRGVLLPDTVAMMRTVQARRFGLPIWGLGTMLYAADGQGSYVIGHEGGNAPAVTTTARFNPSTGDGLVILQTGRPELPVRLGAEWIRWQTGRTDIVALRHYAPVYLALVLAGWLLIGLGAAVLASRWVRRIAVKLHGSRSAN